MKSWTVCGGRCRAFTAHSMDDEEGGASGSVECTACARVESATGVRLRCAHTRQVVPGARTRVRRGRGGPRRASEVRAPTRVELYAHGPLLVGRPVEKPATGPRSLPEVKPRSSCGSSLAKHALGSGSSRRTRQSGNGTNLDTAAVRSYLGENREWLKFARCCRDGTVALRAGALKLGELVVNGVDSTAVADIELMGSPTRDADDGAQLCVVAQGYDADGNPVYGVEYAWKIEGSTQAGMGDLFRYTFADDHEVSIQADAIAGADPDALRAEGTISASDGYVSSTNNVGCSITRGRPGWMPAAMLGLGVLAAATRRRRSR